MSCRVSLPMSCRISLPMSCRVSLPGFHTGFFVGEGKKRSRKVTHANT